MLSRTSRLGDKTLRTLAAAQVQLCQHDPATIRGATRSNGGFVVKNAFRDKTPARVVPPVRFAFSGNNFEKCQGRRAICLSALSSLSSFASSLTRRGRQLFLLAASAVSADSPFAEVPDNFKPRPRDAQHSRVSLSDLSRVSDFFDGRAHAATIRHASDHEDIT
jgi:hypothetical protein